MTTASGPEVDGRFLRRERNREAAVDALVSTHTALLTPRGRP